MSAKKQVKKVLIVEPSADNALRLSHQLEFIDYEAKSLSSPELLDSLGDLEGYCCILVAQISMASSTGRHGSRKSMRTAHRWRCCLVISRPT